MPTKAQLAEQTEALEELRKILKPGDTVRTILRHVSSSGMSRSISAVIVNKDGSISQIDWLIQRAGIAKFDRNHDGLKMGGAGMDMGFALVYNLSRAMFPNGFKCSGNDGSKDRHKRCPSNDHSNYRSWIEQGTWNREKGEWEGQVLNPEPNYKKGKQHSDGGYALNQQWL